MSISWTKYAWLFIFIALYGYVLQGQQNTPTSYSIIELAIDQKEDISILLDLGIAADHVHWHGAKAELFLSDRELSILDNNGFEYDFIIRDTKLHADKLASEHDKEELKIQTCGLDEFRFGEIGGYLSYTEVVDRLKEIDFLYPEIASTTVLGQSYEGNDIIALKISDNVDVNEHLFEGSVYYDALTHAREPLSMMSTLFYIEWLLENYDNPNTIAKYLVDNRQMHFVLVVNPDGYEFNKSQAPNGGGGWRKNRKRVDNNECIGVDLNRNFNAQYFGLPGTHSDVSCAETYRGTNPASEIETKLIQNYIDSVQPAIAFSSHSYSDLMIDPSSVLDPSQYPDYVFDIYSKYASEFTPESYHGYGPALNMIGYEASGTTMGYLSEAGAIGWSPEIGTQFWEPREKICENVIKMLEPMKFISKVAGPIPVYHNHFVPDNSFVINGETIDLIVGIQNKGLRESNQTFTAILSTNSAGVSIQNPQYDFKPKRDFEILYNEEQPFLIDIADIDLDMPIEFEMKIYSGDLMIDYSTFEILPGSQKIIFEEDFESGLSNWFQSNDLNRWSISSSDPKSGNFSLVDSKEFHDNLAQSSIGLIDPIDLSEAVRPFLIFDLKRSFGPSGGHGSLYVSENNSLSDLSLGNLILKTYNGNSYWIQEAIDLTYVAENFGPVYLKYLVQVGGNRITDGLYVDNIKIVDLGLDQTTSNENLAIDQEQINVYPNPTYNTITIASETYVGFTNVEICNAMGQKVKQLRFKSASNQTTVDLSGEPAGTYFIKTLTPTGIILKKITKI